jgi:hypothetical protein
VLARLHELVQHPAAFLAQQGLDLGQRRPARRADRQALGTHREADGAPPPAPERVGHLGVAQHDVAVGLRVAEGGRGQGLPQLERGALPLTIESVAGGA